MLTKSSVRTDAGRDPIAQAFAREERSGLAYALWGRLVVLGALLVYVLAALPAGSSYRYATIIVLFMALGVIPHVMRRRGLVWLGWTIGFMLLEVAILTYMLIVPPPFIGGAPDAASATP